MAHTCNPAFGKLKQEDDHEFKASLDHKKGPYLTLTTKY